MSKSLLDLTADDALWVEEAVGKPVDDWDSVPKGKLLPLVAAVFDAEGDAKRRDALVVEYRKRPLGELLELVSFEDPEPKGDSAR